VKFKGGTIFMAKNNVEKGEEERENATEMGMRKAN
jgi:hypothetical protein